MYQGRTNMIMFVIKLILDPSVVNIPIYSLSLLLFIVSITFSDIVLTLII